jgi:hypothetical protein
MCTCVSYVRLMYGFSDKTIGLVYMQSLAHVYTHCTPNLQVLTLECTMHWKYACVHSIAAAHGAKHTQLGARIFKQTHVHDVGPYVCPAMNMPHVGPYVCPAMNMPHALGTYHDVCIIGCIIHG